MNIFQRDAYSITPRDSDFLKKENWEKTSENWTNHEKIGYNGINLHKTSEIGEENESCNTAFDYFCYMVLRKFHDFQGVPVRHEEKRQNPHQLHRKHRQGRLAGFGRDHRDRNV